MKMLEIANIIRETADSWPDKTETARRFRQGCYTVAHEIAAVAFSRTSPSSEHAYRNFLQACGAPLDGGVNN
jgi:hypothetical protein